LASYPSQTSNYHAIARLFSCTRQQTGLAEVITHPLAKSVLF
jgi:hypothetical protein